MTEFIDYYELLGIASTASERDIKKAYRSQALLCHPDKVGNSPELAAQFQKIKLAVDTLTDPVKKKIHDDIVRTKLLKQERFKEMDEKRRIGKEELELRESAAKKSKTFTKEEEEKLKIERIREENLAALYAKQQQLKQQRSVSLNQAHSLKSSNQIINSASINDCTLKVKWSKESSLDVKKLREIDGVENVIQKPEKRSALMVFKTIVDAYKALNNSNLRKVVKMDWIDGKEPEAVEHIKKMYEPAAQQKQAKFQPSIIKASTFGKGQRYEDITLEKMRERERERLIQELLAKEGS